METKLNIQSLGALVVSYPGGTIEQWSATKIGALLVYLAFTGQSQTRERLAALFWEESSQVHAYGSLRMALAALRHYLAPYLDVTRQGVALIPDSYRLDASILTREVDAARPALAGEKLNEVLAKPLAEAVNLYRDEFLRDFYGGSPEFEEWLLIERTRLKTYFCEGVQYLIEHYLQRAAYREGLTLARRALVVDPLHETLNGHLMLLLARIGQFSAAFEHYEHFCHLLQARIGVEPAAETTLLYQRLLAEHGGTFNPPIWGVNPSAMAI